MIIELNTNFSKGEVKSLKKYNDVCIKLFIDKNKLYREIHSYVGDIAYKLIENPNRIIEVGGYLLVEIKDELGSWYIGDYNKKEDIYLFWGKCNNLKSALYSL